MLPIKYNEKQINELKNNQYVVNCTKNHIVFSTDFKQKSVDLFNTGILAVDVFEKLGFPDYVIKSPVPSNSIGRWKYNLKTKGKIEGIKGRPKKQKS